MKIRNGFVSNSSSSSFILPVKDEKFTIEISLENFKKVFENSYESKIDKIVKTEEQLKDYLIYQYGYKEKNWEEFIENEDNEYALKLFEEGKKVLDSGSFLMYGRVSYSEDMMAEIIRQMGGKIEN